MPGADCCRISEPSTSSQGLTSSQLDLASHETVYIGKSRYKNMLWSLGNHGNTYHLGQEFPIGKFVDVYFLQGRRNVTTWWEHILKPVRCVVWFWGQANHKNHQIFWRVKIYIYIYTYISTPEGKDCLPTIFFSGGYVKLRRSLITFAIKNSQM